MGIPECKIGAFSPGTNKKRQGTANLPPLFLARQDKCPLLTSDVRLRIAGRLDDCAHRAELPSC